MSETTALANRLCNLVSGESVVIYRGRKLEGEYFNVIRLSGAKPVYQMRTSQAETIDELVAVLDMVLPENDQRDSNGLDVDKDNRK